jgi:hypothetical protein
MNRWWQLSAPVTCLATVCAAISASGSARADEPRAHLNVSRSQEASDCPESSTLAAAVERARGQRSLTTGSDGKADLQLRVEFSRGDPGYVATVGATGIRQGIRTITDKGPSCSMLAEAVVLAVTVMLDEITPRAATAPRTAPAARVAPPDPDDVPPPDEALPARRQRPRSGERTAYNSLFVEIFGSGGLYSLNYEHLFGNSNVSVRAGFDYFHLSQALGLPANQTFLGFPVLGNYYLGGADHKLQLGAGALVAYQSTAGFKTQVGAAAALVVGYRYIPHDGGLDFGVAFTPMIGTGEYFPSFLPWGGVSLGAGF